MLEKMIEQHTRSYATTVREFLSSLGIHVSDDEKIAGITLGKVGNNVAINVTVTEVSLCPNSSRHSATSSGLLCLPAKARTQSSAQSVTGGLPPRSVLVCAMAAVPRVAF
jgi:hypothetical protein